MMEESPFPKIRFSEFNNFWELVRICDVAEKITGGGTPNTNLPAYWSGNIPWIQSSDVKEDCVVGLKVNKYISEEGLRNSSANLIPSNSIAIVTRVGVGKLALIRHPYTTSQDFMSLSKLKTDSLFTAYLCFQKINSELNAVQGTAIKGITKDELLSKEIKIPSFIEQSKIGSLFSSLDSLITANQQQLEKLKTFKKSMLQKMFPQAGADVPEIRFKGFIKPWKPLALKDFVEHVTSKNTDMLYTEVFTNSAEYGIISQRDFFDHDIAKYNKINDYYVVKPEDFVYNPRISVSAPVGPINRNALGRTGVMSPLYTVFRPYGMDNVFLEQFFKSSIWHSFMKFNGDSGARSDRFSIRNDVFYEMPVPCTNIEEQYKIGEYLSSLDSLISLQSSRLDKLLTLKKSLLERMFC